MKRMIAFLSIAALSVICVMSFTGCEDEYGVYKVSEEEWKAAVTGYPLSNCTIYGEDVHAGDGSVDRWERYKYDGNIGLIRESRGGQKYVLSGNGNAVEYVVRKDHGIEKHDVGDFDGTIRTAFAEFNHYLFAKEFKQSYSVFKFDKESRSYVFYSAEGRSFSVGRTVRVIMKFEDKNLRYFELEYKAGRILRAEIYDIGTTVVEAPQEITDNAVYVP